MFQVISSASLYMYGTDHLTHSELEKVKKIMLAMGPPFITDFCVAVRLHLALGILQGYIDLGHPEDIN